MKLEIGTIIMNKLNDGGPAFPHANTRNDGMTLRDYFAAKAMHVFIDRLYNLTKDGMMISNGDTGIAEVAAYKAYAMADAMIKARSGE